MSNNYNYSLYYSGVNGEASDLFDYFKRGEVIIREWKKLMAILNENGLKNEALEVSDALAADDNNYYEVVYIDGFSHKYNELMDFCDRKSININCFSESQLNDIKANGYYNARLVKPVEVR